MKVHELIEQLSQLNPDLHVHTRDCCNGVNAEPTAREYVYHAGASGTYDARENCCNMRDERKHRRGVMIE